MKIISIVGVLGCASGALAADGNAANPAATPPAKEGNMQTLAPAGQYIIANLGEYQVIDPLFESLRIILVQRGDNYSADYIQGISGSAFRIAGICPCAPTCSNATWPDKLGQLLGYKVDVLSMEQAGVKWEKLEAFARLIKGDQLPEASTLSDPEFKKIYDKAVEIIDTVKREVAAGRPVLVWHAFTNAEYDVVCGYDQTARQFIGRGSYKGDKGPYARAGEARMITAAFIGGWPAAIVVGPKTGKPDTTSAEIAALREAVRHARDQKNVDKAGGEKWVMLEGIAAYERWTSDYQKPDKKRGAGDAYCFGIYRHTHRSAATFLRDIATKYPKAQQPLRLAADAFEKEAQTLSGGEKLLWWNSPEGPDAARNAAAAKLLREACDNYKAGIEQLEKALPLVQG